MFCQMLQRVLHFFLCKCIYIGYIPICWPAEISKWRKRDHKRERRKQKRKEGGIERGREEEGRREEEGKGIQ